MTACSFRYQDQYEDIETGLYYNRFRYYSPKEGMYISQDPIGLNGGIKGYMYVHNSNRWIDSLGLTKTLAEIEADKVRNLPADQRPNTVAVIETKDGQIFTGRYQEGIFNQEVQTKLDDIPPNDFHRQCAEVNTISKARNAKVDLDGATITVANVRGPNSVTDVHGTTKKPCSVCDPLLEKYNITYNAGCK